MPRDRWLYAGYTLGGEKLTMNTTTKHATPLYNCGISINIQDVQRHRRLYNYFIGYYRNQVKHLDFPRQTCLILEFIPQLCFVPCFLLAYTCCRVGELKQIKISDIRKGEPIIIKSSKSKHIRTVPALSNFRPNIRMSIDPKTMMMVVSYDHLKNAIHQAKKRAKLPRINGALDVTHVFRHYEATYLHSKGVDIELISERLGHLINDTTLNYIHQ